MNNVLATMAASSCSLTTVVYPVGTKVVKYFRNGRFWGEIIEEHGHNDKTDPTRTSPYYVVQYSDGRQETIRTEDPDCSVLLRELHRAVKIAKRRLSNDNKQEDKTVAVSAARPSTTTTTTTNSQEVTIDKNENACCEQENHSDTNEAKVAKQQPQESTPLARKRKYDQDDSQTKFSSNGTALDAGTRVTVYWSDDDEWYKGTVAKKLDGKVFIEYDDGDADWMDPSETKWRASRKPDVFLMRETDRTRKKQKRIDNNLVVGSRLSVYWPKEKEWYTGTLAEILDDDKNNNNKNRPHHIKYDDGDEEWIHLLHRRFKVVEKKAKRLHVGSRVSVYDSVEKRHYPGIVIKIKRQQARPHRVRYDDGGKQWLNLNVHPFLDIEETEAASSSKKRNREFMVHPQQNESPQKRQRIEQELVETSPTCAELCALCRSRANRPRATSCHHIFCKLCIREHCETAGQTCPLCKFPITTERTKYDPDHVSFKPLEALERTTLDVVYTFSSSSAASMGKELSNVVPNRVIEACQSKRREDREYRGYYWRFQGSRDRILRLGESIKDGIPIEQINLKTGEVIQTFSSQRKAYEKTGVARCSIRRVLEQKGKANAGGYFWRFQGETHGPWPDPEPLNLTAVEKLDFETGDVLDSYNSLADAKRAMGMKPNSACIREVCEGKDRATALGYFWRWKGSKALPNHLMGVQKIVQIRKHKNGLVVKEFRTSREAQAFFGYQCCWSTICRWCREESYQNGYFWQYHMLKEQKSAEETVVGKRLRVQQAVGGNEWLEGKIVAFHSNTGKHEILLDCGITKYYKLKEIKYEWKNDQGQKPIEQLDLKTGEVLATFDSISDALAHVGSDSVSAISSVLNGHQPSRFGYFWRYKGSNALPRKLKTKRKVEQLCLKTGKVIAAHDSITAAGKAVGITTPGISYCCNGRNGSKSAGGYGWRFAAELK